MTEAVVKIISRLTFTQLLITLGFAVVCVMILVFSVSAALDKLNVKTFSLVPWKVTFYQDGEARRSRITRRAVVRRPAKK